MRNTVMCDESFSHLSHRQQVIVSKYVTSEIIQEALQAPNLKLILNVTHFDVLELLYILSSRFFSWKC